MTALLNHPWIQSLSSEEDHLFNSSQENTLFGNPPGQSLFIPKQQDTPLQKSKPVSPPESVTSQSPPKHNAHTFGKAPKEEFLKRAKGLFDYSSGVKADSPESPPKPRAYISSNEVNMISNSFVSEKKKIENRAREKSIGKSRNLGEGGSVRKKEFSFIKKGGKWEWGTQRRKPPILRNYSGVGKRPVESGGVAVEREGVFKGKVCRTAYKPKIKKFRVFRNEEMKFSNRTLKHHLDVGSKHSKKFGFSWNY